MPQQNPDLEDEEEEDWEPEEREKLERHAKVLMEFMPQSLRPHMHKLAFRSEVQLFSSIKYYLATKLLQVYGRNARMPCTLRW